MEKILKTPEKDPKTKKRQSTISNAVLLSLSNRSLFKKSPIDDTADDSSDDEMLKEAISSYSVKKRSNAFNKKNNGGGKRNYRLAFIPHALGTELLYSEAINKVYYGDTGFKNKNLKKSELLTGEKNLKERLREVLLISISEIIVDPHDYIAQKLEKDIKNKVDALFKIFDFRAGIAQEKFLSEAGKISKNFFQLIKEIINQKFEPREISSNQFAAKNVLAKCSTSDVIENHKIDIKKFLVDKKLVDKDNIKKTSPKGKRIKILANSLLQEEMKNSEMLRRMIISTLKNEKNSRYIENFIDDNKQQLSEAIVFDLLSKESADQKSPIKKLPVNFRLKSLSSEISNSKFQLEKAVGSDKKVQNKELALLLEKTKPYKEKKIITILPKFKNKFRPNSKNFISCFKKEIKLLKENEIRWERSVLPIQHTQPVNNACEFLASLRLFNRSQKRTVRQKKQDQSEGINEVSHKALFFKAIGYTALETQEITKKDTRKDMVPMLGSYSKIYEQMCIVKDRLNQHLKNNNKQKITDCEIAMAIRAILKGEKEPLQYKETGKKLIVDSWILKPTLKFLVNLTYLLFFTEVSRNPASLITHQMALDLIIDYNFTWEQIIADKNGEYKGGLIPMTLGKSLKSNKHKKAEVVKSARSLNRLFAPYMLHNYDYEGEAQSNLDKSELLLQKEKNIVAIWFKKTKVDGEKFRYNKFFDKVKSQYKKWFDLTLPDEVNKIITSTIPGSQV